MQPDSQPSQRGTIFVEEARIIAQQVFPGEQYWLRVKAPKCANSAQPGSFAHIQCHPLQLMRRPLSIMRVSTQNGWVEFLYKHVGAGTHLLSQRKIGDSLNLMGPIGRPFTPDPERPLLLLIGGGVGIPPMIFLAETCRQIHADFMPFALLGSEIPFPFQIEEAFSQLPKLAEEASASAAFLNDQKIPSRLASLEGYAGCYRGYVTDLARQWLLTLPKLALNQVQIMACGPEPMLAAAARVAKDFAVPCHLSLEEYMACAVGGCAGCVVAIETPQGKAMKRVCVDGPVFDARTVFPELWQAASTD